MNSWSLYLIDKLKYPWLVGVLHAVDKTQMSQQLSMVLKNEVRQVINRYKMNIKKELLLYQTRLKALWGFQEVESSQKNKIPWKPQLEESTKKSHTPEKQTISFRFKGWK